MTAMLKGIGSRSAPVSRSRAGPARPPKAWLGRRALQGFAAALLPPESGGPDPDRLAARLGEYLSRMPLPARAALQTGFAAVDAAALVRTGRRLGSLDVSGRERLLDALERRPASAIAFEGLKAVTLLAAGAESATAQIAAYNMAEGPARPDAQLTVIPAGEWPSRTRCDVVVVGSGAGGATAASTLARAGADVVVVEEGRRFSVEEFRRGHPLERFGDLYRDAGATACLGRTPIVMPIGRGVGGTTLVNSGTCYRTPTVVLEAWRDEAGLTLADPERFAGHLDRVEEMLQVAAVPAEVMGRNGALMLAGAAALGWAAGPLRRNAPGCGGCCQCAIGCPRNAKFGVHLNALPEACAAGARILSEARVERVLYDGVSAVGVLVRRADGSGLEVLAPRVVLAAGATETPPLLRRSGLGRHHHLGRHLSVHPAVSAAGRFEEEVVAWEGVLQSAGMEEFHAAEGILVEATATPAGMGSMMLPGHGRRLLAELGQTRHLSTLGAMIADEGRGRVLGRRRPLVVYDLSRSDARRLVRSIQIMGTLLFAAGAREVVTGVGGAARSPTELDEVLDTADPRRLHVAAFHPTASAGAGADPERYPVDPTGRLRGIEGVWVADASVLPSCPTVNPQVTVMAMASAIAEGIT